MPHLTSTGHISPISLVPRGERTPPRGADVTTISGGGQFSDGVRMDAGAVNERKVCV
jgi:hypothetical protein